MFTEITDPPWLTEARRHIGEREYPGQRHNSLILGWWRAIRRGGIKDDETPWCAAFVGGCLEAVGIVSSRFESARSYLTWGQPLRGPVAGAVAVLSRDGGGHVAFVVGRDKLNNVLLLGGNQGDAVSIAAFAPTRVVAYRWPTAVPVPEFAPLNVASAQLSRSEA